MAKTPSPAYADVSSPAEVPGVAVDEPDIERTSSADEVDLSRYGRALQRHWKLIAAGGVVGMLVGAVTTLRQPILYEAATTLLIDRANSPAALSTAGALLRNYSLAQQTIKEAGLDRPPSALTAQAFVNSALQIEEVRGTNLLRVKVTLTDPKRAADASRLLSAKAVALNRQIVTDSSTALRDQLKVLLDEAAARLDIAQKQLVAYQGQAQLDLLKTDTDAVLDQRSLLLDLQVRIQKEKATLAAAEQELQKQPALLSVPRIPGAEEALRRAIIVPAAPARDAADGRRSRSIASPSNSSSPPSNSSSPPSSASSPAAAAAGTDPAAAATRRVKPDAGSEETDIATAPLDASNPFVNPVYQTLALQVAITRTRLAALERQQRELSVVANVGSNRLRQFDELYQKQTELSRFRDSYELARRTYADIASRYEQSRAQSIGDTAQLQIVDPAIPPELPLSRKRVQTAGLGFTAGVLLASLVALVLSARSGEGHHSFALGARPYKR